MNFSILSVNLSEICYQTSPSIWTSEYYRYCTMLMISVLRQIPKPINIIFGDIPYEFNNGNKTIKIDIQSEHTLVKLGGRSVDEIIYGDIDLLDGSGKYLIRIPNYDYYSKLDATIEYSLPNIANLKTNDKFADYLTRAIYTAPLIYNSIDFKLGDRKDTVSLSNDSERRSALFQNLKVTHIQNVISKEALKYFYDRTKIIVNVHQTDHHHTFEELRVLPALCNGVIIVSEDVPLKETIPYADSIIWSSYGDMAKTVLDVQQNYERYHHQIFTPQLEAKLAELHNNNVGNYLTFLSKLT